MSNGPKEPKAMMSNQQDRELAIFLAAQGCGAFGIHWTNVAADHALAEAERVLAETEPARSFGVDGMTGAPVMLTVYGTLGDTIQPERRIGARRPKPRQAPALSALKSALTAILPELDRLAEQATKDAYLSPRVMEEDAFWSLWDRNRATLTGMEAR